VRPAVSVAAALPDALVVVVEFTSAVRLALAADVAPGEAEETTDDVSPAAATDPVAGVLLDVRDAWSLAVAEPDALGVTDVITVAVSETETTSDSM
jgi:hypothetical protein